MVNLSLALHWFALIVFLCDFSILIYFISLMLFRAHLFVLLVFLMFSPHSDAADTVLPASSVSAASSEQTTYIEAQEVEGKKVPGLKRMATLSCNKALKRSSPTM